MIEKIFDVKHIIEKDRLVLMEQAELLNWDWFHATAVCELLRLDRPIRNAARSALRYLQRAQLLRESMPELALFCLITAEEEAATTLFHSLSERGYRDADRLKRHNHRHKAALWPFLRSVGRAINPKKHFNPKLVFRFEETTQRHMLETCITLRLQHGDEQLVYPQPPLNFNLTLNGQPYPLEKQMSALAGEENIKSIRLLIEDRTNLRNLALYASPAGIPHAKNLGQDFSERQRIVFDLFFVSLLIAQAREHQSFVEHSLKAFVNLLDQKNTV
jgi:hypothetical protein